MAARAPNYGPSLDVTLTGLVLGTLTALGGLVAGAVLGLGADYALRATVYFAAAVGIIALFLVGVAPAFFGAANRVTLLRVAVLALVAAVLGEAPSNALSWTIVVIVTAALFLDGLDGRIARRTGTRSAFGARFDMETDAALVMVLCLLCWQFGKAGVWILAAGSMRYAFVLAGRAWPWLRAPLPESRRRQAVCIWQSGLLLGVISPVFPVPASDVLAAGTLALIATSFAIDVRWLFTNR